MKKHSGIISLTMVSVVCLLVLFEAHIQAKQPNIIFVLIDDCSAVEFSTYATENHASGHHTPVIDALAHEGLKFNSCWATPLCMPSRALLMSGKYGANTGVYGNKLNRPARNFAEVHQPISKTLKENGYETAISGKWHLPGDVVDEAWGWDEYSLLGAYYSPHHQDIVWDGLWFSWSKASHTFPDTAIIGKNKGKYPAMYWHGAVIENGELLPSDAHTYAPDLCQKFAINYITKEREKPFFLYYAIVLPHDPWLGTPDIHNPGQRTKPGIGNLIQRTEFYMDELISTLKEKGLFENTLLVFTADNATLRNGKGSCSELGVRVPLIVAGGVLKNKGVAETLVDFSDMYPTLMDIAGISPSVVSHLDGKSFYPVLEGEKYKEKPYIFSYLDMERCIRNKDYMMDGWGGIWKCSKDGNILDYEAVSEGEKTMTIRARFMKQLELYPLPSADRFGKQRIQSVKRNFTWPAYHHSMVQAVKNQDEWMNNPRRFEE